MNIWMNWLYECTSEGIECTFKQAYVTSIHLNKSDKLFRINYGADKIHIGLIILAINQL